MNGKINENLLLTSFKFIKHKEYWLGKLSAEIAETTLLADNEIKPNIPKGHSSLEIPFPDFLGLSTIKLGKQSDVAIYIILLAVLKSLIYRCTGNEDITVISPLYQANVSNKTMNDCVFIRDSIDENTTFRDLLLQLKQTVLDAYAHQDYPSDRLVKTLFKTSASLENTRISNVVCAFKGLHTNGTPEKEKDKLIFTFSRKGDGLAGYISYNPGIYAGNDYYINRVSHHFIALLERLIEDINGKIFQIPFLSEKEKKRLLDDFNGPESAYPGDKTLHQLIEEQAADTPDHIALIGQIPRPKSKIPGKETPFGQILNAFGRNVSITYNQLNEKSSRLAHLLKEKGVEPETIVGLIVERSMTIIIGILAILKAGGAYLPIDPDYPEERIKYMLADSRAKVLVTTSTLVQEYKMLRSLEVKRDIQTIFSDTYEFFNFSTSHLLNFSTSHPSNLAYVIYTSGSTGKPKGVMIEHANVIAYIHAFHREFHLTSADTVIQQASSSFDVFVEEVFPILTRGGKLAIPGKQVIIDMNLLAEYILENNITLISCSPLLLNELNQLSGIRSITTFISGGDELKAGHVDHIVKTGNVYNTYGPTETTVCVTYYKCSPACVSQSNIPIGSPISNYKVYILDRNDQLVPIGAPGEMGVSGVGLARGYLNRPGLTAKKFTRADSPHSSFVIGSSSQLSTNDQCPMTNDRSSKSLPHDRLYRTGDLARWLWDGNIQFLGRIDHQVKIRGYRIELGEIENRLKKHTQIKDAVVLIKEDETGDRFLSAYYIPGLGISVSKLREYLAAQLPEYMIPSYFMPLEQLPLTSSGKLDRQALPVPVAQSGATYVAPRNKIEEKLTLLWSQILSIEKHKIGIDDNFFELGGHSLKATVLASRIHKEFDVKVPLKAIFNIPTIRGFAGHIAISIQDRFATIEAIEKKDYYPLSSAQKRQYILQQVELETILYNMPDVIPLAEEPDIEKLQNTFKQLINRYESLRTSFHMVEDEPVQRIHDDIDIKIEYFDLKINRLEVKFEENEGTRGLAPMSKEPAAHGPQLKTNTIKNFIRPFDLSQAPLLRVGLMVTGDEEYILLVDMHHIISDGASEDILAEEIIALHDGEKLPPLRIQYKDFAGWQNSEKEKKNIKKQEAYWLGQFEDEIPVLNIPTDFTRPMIQDFSGSVVTFEISPRHTRQLKTMALQERATMYMMVLAVLNVLLSKFCNQEDIVVGTPIEGRRHTYLEKIIGMFVNTLALRNQPIGLKTFRQFLTEVKEKTLEAFENQDYPFEDLVDKLLVNRDAGRNPLFDVMYTLQSMDKDTGRDAQKQKRAPDQPQEGNKDIMHISKFDMIFGGVEAGEKLFFAVEYCTKLFKKETIIQFFNYFKHIVTSIVKDPKKQIWQIEILTGEVKNRILYDFNCTETVYPKDKTIQRLFAEQVEKTPDHTALVGSRHYSSTVGKEEDIYLTYRELNLQSDQLACLLKEKGVTPDIVVGIMVERSVEMIIGILGILIAGGAYLPIEPGHPQERIRYMLTDSNSKVLVTTSVLFKEDMDTKIGRWEDRKNLEIVFLSSSNLPPLFSSSLPHFLASHPTNLAYIIYTSGSTGKPKGVLTSHYNVTRVVRDTNYIVLNENDRVLQLSNYAFDGSVFDIYGALLNGAALVMLPPEKVIAVNHLSEIITKEKITVFFVTTALFNLLVDEAPGIFDNIRKILFGGEKVSVQHAKKALAYSGMGKIIHMYGPTETTVYSTFYDINAIDEKSATIPIGIPLSNTTAYILDHYMQPVPVGVIGEIYIGGWGAARGYLNLPELTAEKFMGWQPHPIMWRQGTKKSAHPQFTNSTNDQCPMTNDSIYLTGDLARWLEDGNIEFIARIDQQVKIRGFRIEPGEIETHLLKHEGITDAKVIPLDSPAGSGISREKEDKYLCAYIIPQKEFSIGEIREYLAKHLPDYMIPSYFMKIEKIPLTPNGKIDRMALPTPVLKSDARYSAPRNRLEEKLAQIWFDVLAAPGAAAEHLSIGIDDDFFELGGHSLKATIMVAKIHKAFNIKVPLAEVFRTPTIRELAAYIKGALEDKYASIEPVEKKEYYVLSSSQKRLYILQHMEPGGMAYNMPEIIPLSGQADARKLQETFIKLITRHESLRTSFHMMADEPVQKVHKNVEFKIEMETEYNVTEIHSLSLILNRFVRPFDLSRAPLLRIGLIKLPHPPTALHGHPTQEGRADKYLLMVDMHHIISDGVSNEILINDFMSFFEGKELPPLRIQYKDFSHWQNREKEKENLKRQEQYWLKEFSAEIPVLHLPTDYTRPMVQSFEGDDVDFKLHAYTSRALKAVALEANATMYMVLLAVFNILLSKLSSQEDIVIGTPTAGRRHADLEPIMGMFVNTLALRNYPRGEKTFNAFLVEVKDKTLQAFENQEYQFEDLVEKAAARRDTGRNPLFDVMFAIQNFGANTRGEGSRESVAVQWERQEQPEQQQDNHQKFFRTAKFDMTLTCVEESESLNFTVEYCTKLFKKETIQRFMDYFKNIVSMVVKYPCMKLRQMEIIPADEKKQVLFDFNDTHKDYPQEKTLHQLFGEQAEKIPDQMAVVCKDEQLTYRQMDSSANKLSSLLRTKGIVSDTIVGLKIDRSLEMILVIMSILKAGGAYMPIAPDYPQERINYMLADSGAKVLVTTGTLTDLPFYSSTPPSSHQHPEPAPANSLAYVIYTSGSTGRPKGVMVEHCSVVNILSMLQETYPIIAKDTYLLKTAITFDVSVTEIFGWFMGDGILVILEKGAEKDPQQILETITTHLVTHINFVPSMFNAFIEILSPENITKLYPLKYIFLAGEALFPKLVKKFRIFNTPIVLENLYGPTEAAIYSSGYSLKEWNDSSNVPIGKPLGNIRLHILDKYGNLQPRGVLGELCIAGVGLARGYLNNPELTAEKFDHNLWDYQDDQDKRKKMPGKNYLPMQPCSHATMQLSPHHSPHYPITPSPHHPIYHTGDLARWLPDGNIEFLGRLDHQLKIRGFRIELGEIENQLLKKEEIKEAVVLDREAESGDKYLCAYIITSNPGAFDQTSALSSHLKDNLSYSLPDYMIPTFYMEIEKLPLTPNGKIDRKALPEPKVKSEARYTAPRNRNEEKLAEIWADVLRSHVSIGIDDNFFELGGHSLTATIMVSKIHKELKVKLPLAQVFKTPSIRGLAQYIRKSREDEYASIEPVEKKEYYALSSSQRRLYILQHMEPGGTAYNIPEIIPLSGEADAAKLEEPFIKLIGRHESLRTSFHMIADEPVQKVHENVEFKIEEIEYNETEIHSLSLILNRFVRPFDLSRAPLLWIGLIKLPHPPTALHDHPSQEGREDKYLLMVDMHHIISDGVSHDILVNDFMALYEDNALPPLRIQYKDFSHWQNRGKEKENLKRQEEYWLKEFSAEIPVLHLPTDYSRPMVQSFEGDDVDFKLDTDTSRALKAIALEANATMYMVLLAVFTILLSKLSSQEDIVIGTPTAGRRHADLEPIIGMFVNTLALRNYPRGEKTFNAFLAEVKEKSLQAFENQEYQFEDLLNLVGINRDVSRNPLFDVMFAFENMAVVPDRREDDEIDIPVTGSAAQESSLIDTKNIFKISKFDLSLSAVETTHTLLFSFEYCTELFKKETICRFSVYYKKIISIIIKDPNIKIRELQVLTEEEKQELLYEFNDTEVSYPSDKVIHQLFKEQAERTPGNIAAVDAFMQISYGELNGKSDRLAHRLREQGIEPDNIIGIIMNLSIEMIVEILGILKSGGAYLPIDSTYPWERIRYMMGDSRVKVLLTRSGTQVEDEVEENFGKPRGLPLQSINIESELTSSPVPSLSTLTSTCQVRPTNLAYIIYTSGSTGQAKGVMVQHHSVVNVLFAYGSAFDLQVGTHVLQAANYTFDPWVEQVFGPLAHGGVVFMIPQELLGQPLEFREFIVSHQVQVIDLVPSVLMLLLAPPNRKLPGVRAVISGGEPLDEELKNELIAEGYELYNHYGPTEATIEALTVVCSPKPVTLGRPVANMRCFILDRYMIPVPPGVGGELCLSGVGLARGYLNNPELTAGKFCLRRPGALFEKTAPGPHKNFLLRGSDKDHIQSCNHATMQLFPRHSPQYPITPTPHSPSTGPGTWPGGTRKGISNF